LKEEDEKENKKERKERSDKEERKTRSGKTTKTKENGAIMSDEELEQNSRVVLSQLKQLQTLAQSPNPDPKKIDVSALHPGTVKILKKLGEEHEKQDLIDDAVPAEGRKEFLEDGRRHPKDIRHRETVVKFAKGQTEDILEQFTGRPCVRTFDGGCSLPIPSEQEVAEMLGGGN